MTTENTTTCARCTRPVADGAYCCTACIDQTAANLQFIEETCDELETTLTRQDRVSAGNGGRGSSEAALPINLRASDVGHRLRNALTTWTRLVAEERGVTIADAFDTCGGDGSWCTHERCRVIRLGGIQEISNGAMAAWLRTRLGWIAHREWGPDAFDALSTVAVDLSRAVDSPPPMISLGTCETDGCDGELRAHQEATFVRCGCGESYDISKRKDQLLRRAEHLRMTAVDLARILTASTPLELPVKHIYNWAQRKKLRPVGIDDHGRPLYRLGDARALHWQAITKAQAKVVQAA